MPVKFIGITGTKKVGKTTTIEQLVPKLIEKGYKIGTVKIAFKPVSIDVNQDHYDVVRHRKANPTKTLFKSSIDTTVFYNEEIELRSALLEFGKNLDFVLIEGFIQDLVGFPQIVLLKKEVNFEEFVNEFTVAISSISEFSVKVKHEKYVDFEDLMKIIEEKSLPLLPSLDCDHCGLKTCNKFIAEVIAGNKKIDDCYVIKHEQATFSLKVNDKDVPCNPFVQTILRNIVVGTVKSIKLDDKEIINLELQFKLDKKSREELKDNE